MQPQREASGMHYFLRIQDCDKSMFIYAQFDVQVTLEYREGTLVPMMDKDFINNHFANIQRY